jgi:hypothetical protein
VFEYIEPHFHQAQLDYMSCSSCNPDYFDEYWATIMAQAQLGINFTLTNAEGRITDIKWHPKDTKLICILNDDSSLVLTRAKQKTALTLHNGRKSVDISMDQYKAMCDLKVGMQLLQSFLEGNSCAHTDESKE